MRSAIAVLAFCLASTSAPAAAPSPESIERLLKAMDAEQNVKNVQQYGDAMLKGTMDRVFQLRPMKPEQKEKLEAVREKLAATMREELSWESMKAIYLEIYAQQFSREEVDAMITFYESPAGRALVVKMPAVLQKSSDLMQARLQGLMQKLQVAIKETLEEK